MKTKIYVLSEPDGPVRYVGKTVQTLARRLSYHCFEARRGGKNHRCNWLRKTGGAVTIDLVDEVEGDGCSEEIALISGLRLLGRPLVNGTSGGEGAPGKLATAATKLKMSLSQRKRLASTEVRRNVSDKLRGRPVSQATRDQISASKKGNVLMTLAVKQKISAARRRIPDADIVRARELVALGGSQESIAALIGCTQSQISRRLYGRRGRYFEGNPVA